VKITAAYSEEFVVVEVTAGVARPCPDPLKRCVFDSSSVLTLNDALSRGGSHIVN